MAGIHAPAPWQGAMIDRAIETADTDERIWAAWLGGSFGSGEQDAFSDIDLHYLVDASESAWFDQHWRRVAADVAGARLVLARGINGLIGGYALTDQFRHLDLIIHGCEAGRAPSAAELYKGNPSVVLYDPRDLLALPPSPSSAAERQPFYPAERVTFFFYMLHAFTVSMQRRERSLTREGAMAIQGLLVDVMLAQNGVRRRGGNKRRNPYLADGQRDCLDRVPACGTDPDSVMGTVGYLSREFIQRARGLARRTGSDWPVDLEAAALTHLSEALHVDPHQFRTPDH